MKISTKKYTVPLILITLAVSLLPTAFIFAQNQNPESIQQQIKELEEQITDLQAQLEAIKKTETPVSEISNFTKTLQRGMTGDEVRDLQKFLKQFPDIYPEGLVTGYFGPLTETAVKKFQEKNGIEQVGVVGPQTRTKLNELAISGASSLAPSISTSTPPTATTTPSEIIVPAPLSLQDTAPPVIFNIQTINVTETSATVTWIINEPANGKISYALSAITATSATDVIIDSNYTANHTINLTNLTAKKTYYYLVTSTDTAGNTTISSEQSFIALTPSQPSLPPSAGWNNIKITSLLNTGNQIQGTNLSFTAGNSNYGLAWIDNRGGSYNLYLTILDLNGNRLTQDIKITNEACGVFRPKIVWNGSDFGIFWESGNNNKTIKFARFDPQGNKLGNDISIVSATGNNYVDTAWNGSGYGFVWSNEDSFYFSRIDQNGNKIISNILVASNVFSGNLQNPKIAWSGTEYGIVWGTRDNRKIYFTEIAADGTKKINDVLASSCDSDVCGLPSVYWDGHAFDAVWANMTAKKMYFTKINPDGVIQGTSLLAEGYFESLKLIWSGSEYGAIWNSNDTGGDLKVLNFVKLDAEGNKKTEIKNIIDLTDPALNNYCVRYPEIVIKDSKYAAVWIDSRKNTAVTCDGDIYFATGN